jgi:hypothetical protein
LLKQLPPSDELEASLLRAREIAEKRGMALVVYFIDMAISEAAIKSPSTDTDHTTQAPKQ